MRASRGHLVRAALSRCASTQFNYRTEPAEPNQQNRTMMQRGLTRHQWGAKNKRSRARHTTRTRLRPSVRHVAASCTLPRLCTMWPFLRGIQIFRSGFCVSSSVSNMVGPDETRRDARALSGSVGRSVGRLGLQQQTGEAAAMPRPFISWLTAVSHYRNDKRRSAVKIRRGGRKPRRRRKLRRMWPCLASVLFPGGWTSWGGRTTSFFKSRPPNFKTYKFYKELKATRLQRYSADTLLQLCFGS